MLKNRTSRPGRVRPLGWPWAAWPSASIGAAALSTLYGCAAPVAGPAPGASVGPGGIAPSWTAADAVPPSTPAREAAGMIDPIAAVRAQLETQLAAPARRVITPDVLWGEPNFAGQPAEPGTQVFEATVRSAEQRIDASASSSSVAEAPPIEAPVPAADADALPVPQPLYAGVESLTQAELIDELLRRLTDLEAPPMRKALAVSGLSLIRPGLRADASVLQRLDPTQAALLERFERLVAELARRIEAGDLAELDAAVVADAVQAMQGPRALSLRNTSLCKRVSGFGVYEPFASYDFIAGREHRAIVYAEVEHFATLPAPSSAGFEVKLQQEVTLFNEADGLAVWQQPAQPIQDVSRRQRRDFYNVQMVTLPANLGVGRYRLKVRVTDVHGGTVDEATLPIRLIADESVRGTNPSGGDPALRPADDLSSDLTVTQRELLRTLAPGLFRDER